MEMAEALEMKFQAIIETPQKSAERPSLIRPRPLGQPSVRHLMLRLKPDPNTGEILLENFLKVHNLFFLKLKTKTSVLHTYN